MKNSIITEAQIVKAIKEYEGGRELNDICRELGCINPRLKDLEDENRKL